MAMQQTARPGEWVETGVGYSDIDFDQYPLRISTDRYTSPEWAARERELVWMRVWRFAGREDELREPGDWKEYRIFDQSYVIVRGRDGQLRGFVNACRHRGNKLCTGGKGSVKRNFLCPYHLWSYDLTGELKGVLRPECVGPIDMSENGLLAVSVDTFAGFIFLNPDPRAEPLAEFLGDAVELLAPYHLEEMTPVMNVRETLDCNWKVVVDAFSEGYHIDGIHPELLRIISIDPSRTRFNFFGDHSVAVAPFEVANVEGFGPEEQVEGIRELPGTFPLVAETLPKFEELVDAHRGPDGKLDLPEGVTPRTLLQQATRETLSAKGLDVSGLTDAQMSDNHGWLLFPNFFMTIRAGEATVILAEPHPDGDPNRCIWQIVAYMFLQPEHRDTWRAEPVEVEERGSYPYFLALQQDYEQMPRQQAGLRNSALEHMTLARDEVVIANFHKVLERHLRAGVAS